MRLYCCSDIHDEFDRFTPKEKVDVILCAGDITNFGSSQPPKFEDAIQWLDDLSLIAPTFYIPGNHDIGLKEQSLAPLRHQNILHAHASFLEWSLYGVSLSVCYDSPNLATKWSHMTANPMAEEAYYSDIPGCDILISHSPPSGVTGTDKKWGDLGSCSLRQWIERQQPKLVICGHIHSPIAREEMIGQTKVINVATKGIYVDL